MGTLPGPGTHGVARRPEVSRLEGQAVFAPGAPQDREGLVGELVALVEGHAEGFELPLEVAGSDAQDHAPSREDVEAGYRFRRQERVAVGEHGDVGLDPQPRGRRRREGQRHVGVEGVVPARPEPAVRRNRVLGDEAGVEARGLDGPRHLADSGSGDELFAGVHAVGRELEGEAHGASIGGPCGGPNALI
jgi:hypothetical protein